MIVWPVVWCLIWAFLPPSIPLTFTGGVGTPPPARAQAPVRGSCDKQILNLKKVSKWPNLYWFYNININHVMFGLPGNDKQGYQSFRRIRQSQLFGFP